MCLYKTWHETPDSRSGGRPFSLLRFVFFIEVWKTVITRSCRPILLVIPSIISTFRNVCCDLHNYLLNVYLMQNFLVLATVEWRL